MFRVRTHRVLIRWRRAAARWKVEVHSFPTRRRTPPTDIGKYFPEPDEKSVRLIMGHTLKRAKHPYSQKIIEMYTSQ